ncbi:MAG TPA: glycosyltransferase [Candidatus Acidoferrales bacterium]|nr:glycosyltransferase [Candidatus Acidoferrales bacterium]
MRVFFGIPTGGAPTAPCLDSLRALALPAGTAAFERAVVTGNFVPAQRDAVVERALRWRADVIVMCDDDMVLPPHALAALSEVLRDDASCALAGALYYSRDGLRPMAVEGWDENDSTKGWIPAFGAAPVAVDGVGFGCVAIRAEAARQLSRPFFPAHVYVELGEGRVRVCDEDYLFCARLRRSGHRVMLHPGVRCGHFDRARGSIAPAAWETPERTSVRRVLTRTGDRYQLTPLQDAPSACVPERRLRADVQYIEVV